MTEFEELALKKITKDYLVDSIYYRINLLSSKYGISNADISKKIGWDPAGFNQKYNRSNDLRITTFVRVYVAVVDLINEKEREIEGLTPSKAGIDELITSDEVAIGVLFNHISAAAEGQEQFLNTPSLVKTYTEMRPFVLMGRRNQRFNDREMKVYIKYSNRQEDE